VSLESIMYQLDLLVFKLSNTISSPEGLYLIIIPSIIERLEKFKCVFKGKRIGDYREIRLAFSCNNDRTCIYVVIELKPLSPEFDTLKAYYYIEGDRCNVSW
jgi:hypothetical protein